MKKNIGFYLFILLTLFFIVISCKKTTPEVKDDKENQTKQNQNQNQNQTNESTNIVRKITEEQFKEALELIERAKQAQAEKYDKENLTNAINNLQKAKDLNDSDPKKAFEHLDLSRKQAQDAYYNSFRLRSLEKKEEALKLFTDLEAMGLNSKNNSSIQNAKDSFDAGEKAFSEKNYTFSYTKYSEAVDTLNKVKQENDKLLQNFELRLKYVEDLIKKAESLNANEYAKDDLNQAKKLLQEAKDLYRNQDRSGSSTKLNEAEKYALEAIRKSEAAIKEKKRLEALEKIKKAGKSLEKAANKEIIDEKGNKKKSLDFKFEFDENKKVEGGNSPNTSYKDILLKAVDYLEKAKEAYYREDYDMAIKYAEMAKKIADSYSGGIKTTYKVRLIPERRDCLWRIAEYDFIYGNPFYWPMIWKANKEKIANPDLIYPGQVFAIPEID